MDIAISEPLENGEREICVGDHVAYGDVNPDGTYMLVQAPTQVDFDAVASALDAMTADEIKWAMRYARTDEATMKGGET
jgi:hypothetical protein